jgi:sugar lactone lactonase YvrE
MMMRGVAFALAVCCVAGFTNHVVSTLAGGGCGGCTSSGAANGNGTAAQFYNPQGVSADRGFLYVGDTSNNIVRAIVIATATVTTLAGGGQYYNNYGYADGVGSNARFFGPAGVVADRNGRLYVADYRNNVIRVIDVAFANVTTFVGGGCAGCTSSGINDGVGSAATFANPAGIALDGAGSTMYVTDQGSNLVRAIAVATRTVRRLAGGGCVACSYAGFVDGLGSAAQFSFPAGVAVDASGYVFVSDSKNNVVRAIVAASGATSTFVGGGCAGCTEVGREDNAGTAALFNGPSGIAADNAGTLYVADNGNNLVRAIVVATGAVTTLAGGGRAGGTTAGSAGGIGSGATFNGPTGVAADATGSVFVAEYSNNLIRQVVDSSGPACTAKLPPNTGSHPCLSGATGGTATAPPTAGGYNTYCGSYSIVCVTDSECAGQPVGTTMRRYEAMSDTFAAAILSPPGNGRYTNAVVCNTDYCNTVASADACISSRVVAPAVTSTGAIVGGVIGALVFLALLAAAYYVVVVKRIPLCRTPTTTKASSSMQTPPHWWTKFAGKVGAGTNGGRTQSVANATQRVPPPASAPASALPASAPPPPPGSPTQATNPAARVVDYFPNTA